MVRPLLDLCGGRRAAKRESRGGICGLGVLVAKVVVKAIGEEGAVKELGVILMQDEEVVVVFKGRSVRGGRASAGSPCHEGSLSQRRLLHGNSEEGLCGH